MSKDTIYRQDAVDALEKSRFPGAPYIDTGIQIALREIKALPSVQSDIIRCKDCKYRASYWGNCRLLEEKYHQSVLVDGDSYCSRAERRTNERFD